MKPIRLLEFLFPVLDFLPPVEEENDKDADDTESEKWESRENDALGGGDEKFHWPVAHSGRRVRDHIQLRVGDDLLPMPGQMFRVVSGVGYINPHGLDKVWWHSKSESVVGKH